MPTPFPGMDPYVEHPGLWPDMHNGLIAELRNTLEPQPRPRLLRGSPTRCHSSTRGVPSSLASSSRVLPLATHQSIVLRSLANDLVYVFRQ